MNMTKIVGSHNLKAGVFIEYTTRPAARSTVFNGAFNFDRNTANPLDANHPYANAHPRIGQRYSEATGHPDANSQFTNVEWFVQDSWRIKRNVTIDAGVRFYHIGPSQSMGDQLAVFLPERFDPAQAPLLIQPVSTPSGRRGLNPITGEILPAVKIGTYVPGSGNPSNGVQLYDEGILDTPPIQVAPRIGVVLGRDRRRPHRDSWRLRRVPRSLQRRHRAAARRTAAAGQHADRQLHDDPELPSTPLSLSPATARTLYSDYNPQYTYNYSVGMQRDLGYQFVADLAYVGSKGRRLLQTRNINAVPYGTNFLPSSIDPTTGQPLPANFLRPYRGYGDILVSEFAGFSDYDALQTGLTAATRRGCVSAWRTRWPLPRTSAARPARPTRRSTRSSTCATATIATSAAGTTSPSTTRTTFPARRLGQRHRQGAPRRLADLRGHQRAQRRDARHRLQHRGRERPHGRRRRRRRLAGRHHLRPEPVARRSLARCGPSPPSASRRRQQPPIASAPRPTTRSSVPAISTGTSRSPR